VLNHLHYDNFCRGIALVLRGESQKAATYVTHNSSLGTLREKMVGTFIRDETPERFRVETGLIRNHERNVTSRQIDLLVHDPWNHAPLYRYDDFVIVHAPTARAVIEVKSYFDKDNFASFMDINSSVRFVTAPLMTPVFGYALEGATIETLAEYLSDAIACDRLKNKEKCDGHPPFLNWPDCIAVQNRNIIGFRPCYGVTSEKQNLPYYFCLLDLSKAVASPSPNADGIETGYFMHLYNLHINGNRDLLTTGSLYQWFNELPVAESGKVWITPTGEVRTGNIKFNSQ
jgi:hypothetical protein